MRLTDGQHLLQLHHILGMTANNMQNMRLQLLMLKRIRRRRLQIEKKERECWVKEWVMLRDLIGPHTTLLVILQRTDLKDYHSYLRMDNAFYHNLLQRLRPRLTRQCHRKPLDANLLLSTTLRYLAEGTNYRSFRFHTYIPHNTMSVLIREVCRAICDKFEDMLLTPTNKEQWKAEADKFSTMWQYHNTIGAIDDKHVAIKKPAKSGSAFWNYKKFNSIILMGLVNAQYKFLWINIGAN